MSQPGVRPFQNGMRSPIVAPLTRGLIALPLVFLTTQTDRYFAWTIRPFLTAAILGSNYVASTFLAIVASRQRVWAYGRVSASVALVFAPITTAATLIHLNKFHTDSFFGWFWIVAYTIYPPMLVWLLIKQLRTPGGDPPRTARVALWVKALFAIHSVVLIPTGLIMFFAPKLAGSFWPWTLTPLTSRALSAWALALGVLALHSLIENDFHRIKVGLACYPVFGVMHVISIIRFNGDIDWTRTSSYIYMGFLATTFLLGAYALRRPPDAYEFAQAPALAA